MANWAAYKEAEIGLPVFKRAKHGLHFKRPDGQIQAEFVGKPCHYLDAGLWKPIDTKLLPLGDGFYGCPHSPVKVHPDGRVAVTGTSYQQRAELPSAKTGLADGDKLIREFSFGKQEMRITEDGFKSEITLNRIPTLTEARKLIASESGTLSKKYLKSLTTATDANGDVHVVTTLAAFRTWLASAIFPVVIDPDFAAGNADCDIYGQNADYATSRTTSATYTNDIVLRCGAAFTSPNYYSGRTYFLFNTSSIGSGNTVTQSNLQARVKVIVTNDTQYIYLLKQDWSAYAADLTNATNRETAFDATLASSKDANFAQGVLSATTYTSGNLDIAYVNITGTTYYSMAIASDYDGTGYDPFWFLLYSSTETTAAYRPVLTVTYTAGGIAIPVAQYYYNRLRRN